MNKDRNALKAGLFIVTTLVAAVVVILLIRGEGAGPSQTRIVAFNLTADLGGLSVGDDVRIGGVKVGVVRDIEFNQLNSDSPRVFVKFSLPASYVLHEDAEIGIQSAVTGPANLNITALGSGKELAKDAQLPGRPDPKSALLAALSRTGPRLEAIAETIETKTVPKVNDTIDSAQTFVKHINDKIDPVVSRYDGVAQKAGDALGEVRDLVGDSKTDFRGTVKNLNIATASVRDKLPPLMDKVTAIIDKTDGGITSARAALEDVQKTAANARDITASARSIVVDNRSRIDTMIKSLKTTSDNLKETSVEVRHSPWRLLYKPTPEEMGNLNIYDSARQFSDGAGSLSDAAQALRDALRDPNADKAQIQKLVEHLDESFKNFHVAEDKLWTAVKQ
jgi:ABC-type transporter Mla subunit MlaD